MITDFNKTKWRFSDADGIEFPLSKDLDCPICKMVVEKGEHVEPTRIVLPALVENRPVALEISKDLFDKIRDMAKETKTKSFQSFQIFYLKGGVEQKIMVNGKSEDAVRLYFKEHYGYEIVRMHVHEST